MTDSELDTAIDRAVRDLMNVDADAAVRARVAARLQRPARRTFVLRLVTIAASAAALILAIVWTGPTPARSDSAPTLARTEAPAPPEHVGTPAPELTATQLSARQDRPSVRTATRRAATMTSSAGIATAAEAPPTSITPLAAIDPITVDPIPSAPIVTSEIVVAPLSPIVELEISSLEPPIARN